MFWIQLDVSKYLYMHILIYIHGIDLQWSFTSMYNHVL